MAASPSRQIPWWLFALVLGLNALWLWLYIVPAGWSEDGLLEITRLTARLSVLLFFLTFAASALFKLWRSAMTRWLLANRRYMGLAFALSHFIHLGALTAFFLVSPEEPALVAVIGGGIGYAFIAALALTSNDRAQRALGANWRRLHLTGSWYLWAIFLNSYAGRVGEGREPEWLFLSLAGLVLSIAFLRSAAWMKLRRRRLAQQAA
jgi:DMSO/TMAO reductase YedYZ heme-binding membrane subunit